MQSATPATPAAHAALDAWLDRRFEDEAPVEPLLELLFGAGLDQAGIEALLRGGRASYPASPCRPGAISRPLPLACDHVDHRAGYLLYVPKSYDPALAWPLVVIGHGGSVARDLAFGEWAARAGMDPFWCDAAEHFGLLLVAPLTDRGWGAIGNSILFSALSRVTRACHVDPDRVYLTGHSMGGHLAWRSAMNFADRWGAVSPMSGGYDYVADRQVESLVDCPGYATWGRREPFGIAHANRANVAWLHAHGSAWVGEEHPGGHEIFPDTIPRVAQFFLARPRDLCRRTVQVRAGGPLAFAAADAHPGWERAHAWRAGRPISTGTFHWLRLEPLPDGTPRAVAVQEVAAALRDDHTIAITSTNARRLRVYLHPRMVDFSRAITVTVNGAVLFQDLVEPDPGMMLRLVREFDDRGRVFHGSIDVEVPESLRRRTPLA